ncbi:hypothetical protein GCM10023189_53610 [Nibrella saemangeumensis]|uniref:DUF4440 domain-containing protein n=1 Tax=Nibrella saemangeumensis TaxID=1084526 RepID=A0ABP8NMM1_9BACT
MKTVLSLIATLVISISAIAQTTANAQDPTAATNGFFKAMLDEDSNSMSQLLASDFTITSFDGRLIDRDMLVQAVGGGYLVVDNASVSNLLTRTYNDNAAIATGNWKAKLSVQGRIMDNTVAFTVVTVKQGGLWKVASVHLSPML